MKHRLPLRVTLPTIFAVALATGFSGAVVPGSLLAVVVTESVQSGWAAGPIMMIGHGVLELAAVVLLITGLIAFARSPRARGTISLVGGAVLLYLGYATIVLTGEAGAEALRADQAASAAGGGWLRLVALGAVMSMINPYWWLWWATIGVAHIGWAVQRGSIGGGVYFVGHVLADVLWYSAVSIALGTGRAFFSPAVLRALYVACALFLFVLGAVFLVAGFRALVGRLRLSAPRGST
jgi:threonine/homoserine/homoserine lactone efflux protein